jgi:Protein of unknown function (DUF3558)
MRAPRATRVAAAGLVLALVVAGCGDDDGPSVPTTTAAAKAPPVAGLPDPCALLDAATLEAATGVRFAEGAKNEELSGGPVAVCDWVADDPFSTVQVLVDASGDHFDSRRESVENAFDEPTVAVDLADEAYRTTDGSLLAMQVGSLFVQVSYFPFEAGDVSAQTEQLAATVLERLG